ncbi:polysaccharide biosynthesis/export family protein [Pontibacter vulgaris]|uniref:polysaccharide biosynthesis/export family protein n=1 Tax=Pontibacter vulgaris TaxID=2905679 RepID=UPI001FA6C9FF|nr:polysaccharide biosynthesis/export family protein [Pontibacter vulgaris]
MLKKHSFLLLLLIAFATSCVSNKDLVYLQNDNFSKDKPYPVTTEKFIYKIQPNDVLSIKVQSIQPEISSIFNISNSPNQLGNSDPGFLFLNGYSVDESGSINLPTVGTVKVAGLTVNDAQKTVQQHIDRYIKNANVIVKLTSFRVTVLGDVRRPGQYYIFNEKATILEGLALAGDIDQSGNRKMVKLIRPTASGSEVVLLDLTDPNLMQSKYYYLLPNDAIYVQPLSSYTRRNNLTLLGVVFSGITTLVLIYNTFK